VLYGAQTSRRRDARRNRAAIVEAASDVLSSREPVALMPEIARRAGVGQATLYRHFPDRYALAAGVIDDRLEQLEARCAATAGEPVRFRPLLREVLHAQIVMRPLVLLAQGLDLGTRHRYERRIGAAFSGPLRSAQEHGYVRGDLGPDDVILLLTMVRGVTASVDDVTLGRSAADRSIDLVLDGVFRVAEPLVCRSE
jgi:AcrR family transcriptional regulator